MFVLELKDPLFLALESGTYLAFSSQVGARRLGNRADDVLLFTRDSIFERRYLGRSADVLRVIHPQSCRDIGKSGILDVHALIGGDDAGAVFEIGEQLLLGFEVCAQNGRAFAERARVLL